MTTSNRIDGRQIADTILVALKEEVQTLKKNHIVPTLAVILIGNDPSSLSYIKQKQKAAEAIGATVDFLNLPDSITDKELKKKILEFNHSPHHHGFIIQRPIPHTATIDPETLSLVNPQKDIDGFISHSPFEPTVAIAVITILEKIFHHSFSAPGIDFVSWLRTQNTVVIGKGDTAGRPIATTLEKLTVPIIIIDRATIEPDTILKNASIIISCIGKEQFVTANKIKKDVILISVGLTRGSDGKLHGDYEEDDIKAKALFYTPTPGGVGPVNVACLMQNLVKAAQNG